MELHEYLNSDAPDSAGARGSSPPPEFAPGPPAAPTEFGFLAPGGAPTSRAERRRSLPVRTSLSSLRSEYSAAAPAPETTAFEKRRRKAAKLTQFFGVVRRLPAFRLLGPAADASCAELPRAPRGDSGEHLERGRGRRGEGHPPPGRSSSELGRLLAMIIAERPLP